MKKIVLYYLIALLLCFGLAYVVYEFVSGQFGDDLALLPEATTLDKETLKKSNLEHADKMLKNPPWILGHDTLSTIHAEVYRNRVEDEYDSLQHPPLMIAAKVPILKAPNDNEKNIVLAIHNPSREGGSIIVVGETEDGKLIWVENDWHNHERSSHFCEYAITFIVHSQDELISTATVCDFGYKCEFENRRINAPDCIDLYIGYRDRRGKLSNFIPLEIEKPEVPETSSDTL